MSEPLKIVSTESDTPVVVDLGKQSRKEIRRLKNHQPGRLMDEVHRVVAGVIGGLGDEAKNKEIIPVVIIYRRKGRKGRGRRSGGGMSLPLPLPFRF